MITDVVLQQETAGDVCELWLFTDAEIIPSIICRSMEEATDTAILIMHLYRGGDYALWHDHDLLRLAGDKQAPWE